jgi:molecular chaperone DnaJ
VEPSPAFERRGQDLLAVLDVPFTRAVLGAELEVATLDGNERIKIEPGTESGTLVRIKGAGVPNLNRRGRGDLYVTIHVTVPGELSKEERRVIEELAALRAEETSKRDPAAGRLRRPEG